MFDLLGDEVEIDEFFYASQRMPLENPFVEINVIPGELLLWRRLFTHHGNISPLN